MDEIRAHGRTKGPKTMNRSTFITPSESPGPAAYNVKDGIAHTHPPVSVFGTSRRENEANRYISGLHNASVPPSDTPGPGTYRAKMFDRSSRSPKKGASPSWKFGSGPQRDVLSTATEAPGPIYNLPDSLSRQATQFGPGGGPQVGITRSRSEAENMFISKQHAEAELPGAARRDYAGIGPKYETSNYTALKKRAPAHGFGTTDRGTLDSMWEEQLKVNPEGTTAVQTPGASYDYEECSTLSKKGTKFGTGPRSYGCSSEPGSPGKGAGPYIGRLHELIQMGTQSPGPSVYGVVTGDSSRNRAVGGFIGDAPKYGFGTALQTQPLKNSLGPGPGAYSPHDEPLSQVRTAPAYGISANLRTDFTALRDTEIPGPGAYDVGAAAYEGNKTIPPAFSLGRSNTRPLNTQGADSPGPGTYNWACDASASREGSPSKARGYTFGARERTVHPNSTVTRRCHGPLHSQETLGLESPGPGLYNVRGAQDKLSPKRRMPDIRFSSAPREGPKLYISKLHGEADFGTESPGPIYDANYTDVSKVTSKFPRGPSATFSTSKRL